MAHRNPHLRPIEAPRDPPEPDEDGHYDVTDEREPDFDDIESDDYGKRPPYA